MANQIEYFVTKLSFREDEKLIKDVFAYEYDGKTLSDGEVRQRHWLVNRKEEGAKISTLTRNNSAKWQRGNDFVYENELFRWNVGLPENIARRNAFVSYYHKDDESKRTEFDNRFHDLVINQSVKKDDIDSDNSDDYIHQLINKDYMKDVTVLIVLLGAKTWCRKHVDWEIAGALNWKVGERYAGLLGLKLPSHPDHGKTTITKASYPKRFLKNVESGYAILKDWTEERATLQSYIESAIANRENDEKIINAEITLLEDDLCE